MRKIAIQPLTLERFAPYGIFTDLLHPAGVSLGGPEALFFPDRLRVWGGTGPTGVSVVSTLWRPLIIDVAEQHDLATEVLLPLDGDIICFAAPACAADFPCEQAEAFLVPRGTAIALFPGVWHKAPFPVHMEQVHTLVLLPERTYAIDCRVQTLRPADQIEILPAPGDLFAKLDHE